MYKIAVIGERASIYGFAELGLEVFPTEEAVSPEKLLKDLAGGGYAVIYVTEQLFSDLLPEIEKYQDSLVPAIIPIPGIHGNTGVGISQVKKSVEQAVGSDIIFNENRQ